MNPTIVDIYSNLVSAWNAVCDYGLTHYLPSVLDNARVQRLYTLLKVGSTVVQRICEALGGGVERDPDTFKLEVII